MSATKLLSAAFAEAMTTPPFRGYQQEALGPGILEASYVAFIDPAVDPDAALAVVEQINYELTPGIHLNHWRVEWRKPIPASQLEADQHEGQLAEDAIKTLEQTVAWLDIAATALLAIANGEGIYGAQAAEYKAIARKAIEDMRR